jgi:diguanylate cyclase (GGDEF)-like protein/PAS domain S-box-containing protein
MIARYRRFVPRSVVLRALAIVACTMAATRLVPDGSLLPGRPISSHDLVYLGGLAAMMWVVLSVAAREARLRESAAAVAQLEIADAMLRLLTIVDTLSDGVFVCNQQGHLTLVNPAGWRLLGLPEDGAQLRPVSELVPLVDMRRSSGEPLDPSELPLTLAQRGEQVHGYSHLIYNALLGDDRFVRVSAAPLRNTDGAVVGAVAVASDVTDEEETLLALEAQARTLRRLNEQLEQLASRDGLTGLYNHRRFVEELITTAARARRYQHCLALMLVDVDHFKRINDTYGHPAGDAVLLEIAGRLQKGVRTTDAVGRLGGDEFAVLLPETDRAGALTLARRLHEATRQPVFLTSGEVVPVTISLGIVCREGDAILSAETLLQDADAALYTVKRAGRDGVAEAPDPPLERAVL